MVERSKRGAAGQTGQDATCKAGPVAKSKSALQRKSGRGGGARVGPAAGLRSADPAGGVATVRTISGLQASSATGSTVAGVAITGAMGSGRQLRKASWRDFTPTRQEAFFTALAETSNITAAAESVGVEVQTIWRWRKKSEEFQRRWSLALAQGYADLEMRLLAQARFGERSEVDTLDDGTGARRARLRRDTPGHGRQLLTIHRQTVMTATMPQLDSDARRPRAEDVDHLIARLRARLAEAPMAGGAETSAKADETCRPMVDEDAVTVAAPPPAAAVMNASRGDADDA